MYFITDNFGADFNSHIHIDPECYTRPVMAIIVTMIRLNCRKVVLETLFWIGCKSAKMSVTGFLW